MGAKSLFSSTTFWGAIGSLIIGYTSIFGKIFIDRNKFTSRDLELLVTMGVTTAITIIGRVNARDPVYTPYILPGPNREDFETMSLSLPEEPPSDQ
jgi:hypothetical protein